MASRDKKDLHHTLVTAYELAKQKYNMLYPELPSPFITCTYRPNEEQNALYAKGRTVKGSKVTNAKGGESPHNFNPSFAFDIAFIGFDNKLDWNKELFNKFNACMEVVSTSLEWGGKWKFTDLPHFELKGWKTLK